MTDVLSPVTLNSFPGLYKLLRRHAELDSASVKLKCHLPQIPNQVRDDDCPVTGHPELVSGSVSPRKSPFGYTDDNTFYVYMVPTEKVFNYNWYK